MDKIKIGKIVNVVGLRGEVKIYSYAETPERFQRIKKLWAEEEVLEIENVRYKGDLPIIKLAGVNTRERAESLKNTDVYMSADELEELPKGEWYIKDLLGSKVILEDGSKIGILKDINTATAQKLYTIELSGGKMVYLPGVADFILHKDGKNKIVTVALPEGILEL